MYIMYKNTLYNNISIAPVRSRYLSLVQLIKIITRASPFTAGIQATTESGLTPLHVAAFMGCMNIVIYLLQHEANPDVPTVRGETPLHLAARANQVYLYENQTSIFRFQHWHELSRLNSSRSKEVLWLSRMVSGTN
jgi:hypothetical protein